MHELFRQHVESLHPTFEALLSCVPFTYSTLPKQLPGAGIYLFTEGEKHLYVGRTNRLRSRLQQHCRIGSGHNSAAFAFRLTRELQNVRKASYKKEGSRAELVKDLAFSAAFTASKLRLCQMQIRVVEESEPLRQALLEMYTAVSLETPYNDFDNH